MCSQVLHKHRMKCVIPEPSYKRGWVTRTCLFARLIILLNIFDRFIFFPLTNSVSIIGLIIGHLVNSIGHSVIDIFVVRFFDGFPVKEEIRCRRHGARYWVRQRTVHRGQLKNTGIALRRGRTQQMLFSTDSIK